jgi:glyoxylase-like metal-dependent hydrolase (beta-lactamase superfamily II)
MRIISFRTGFISANTYIVYDENTLEGFIIDPGGNYKRIIKETEDNKIRLKAQLLTHGHFDHCGASAELQEYGVPVYIHCLDADKLTSEGNLAGFFGLPFENFRADKILKGGETLIIAGMQIKVLHTPGHSEGGVCYICGNKIFCGDTIFYMSVGRTDFGDGNAQTLNDSIINKLFKLEGDYELYPGHGQPTTLEFERKNNPMVF